MHQSSSGRRLREDLHAFSVDTVREMGWAGRQDHILVPKTQGRFDVFVTIGKGFEFEHDLKKLSFGIVVLETASNQMPSYERVMQELARLIQCVASGQVVRVTDPER